MRTETMGGLPQSIPSPQRSLNKGNLFFLVLGMFFGIFMAKALQSGRDMSSLNSPETDMLRAGKALEISLASPQNSLSAQLKADLEAQAGLMDIRPEKGEFHWPRALEVKERPSRGHSFFKVSRAFDPRLDLTRVSEIPASHLEEMLLSVAPAYLRPNMAKFVGLGLKVAEKYQVDPFWVLAVMWTESQFNPYALSPRQAMGLMQIMPQTGHFLAHRIYRPLSAGVARDITWVPSINVEMGVFYLRKLVRMFQNDYGLATMAYNMGPYAVKNRIVAKQSLYPGNLYLEKVSFYYKVLSAPYRQYLRQGPKAYTNTFVVRSRMAKGLPSAEQILALESLPDARQLLVSVQDAS